MDIYALYDLYFVIALHVFPLVICIMATLGRGPIAYTVATCYSPERKRGNHDIRAHCLFEGLIGIVCIILFILAFVGRVYSIMWIFYFLLVMSVIVPIIGLIYRKTGQRFLLRKDE